jgi:hypothetical protein
LEQRHHRLELHRPHIVPRPVLQRSSAVHNRVDAVENRMPIRRARKHRDVLLQPHDLRVPHAGGCNIARERHDLVFRREEARDDG